MMNNPAIQYGFGNPMPQGHNMSAGPQAQFAQNPYPSAPFPNQYQRPRQIPPQQQLQQQAPHLFQQQPQQNHGFGRPDSRGNPNLGQGFNQAQHGFNHQNPPQGPGLANPQQINTSQGQPSIPMSTATASGNVMAQAQMTPNTNLAQQAQMQNAAQTKTVPPAGGSASPQSANRERARVSVLLDINTHLLQEVVSLQAQGKAGAAPNPAQQSPSSPNPGADSNNPLNNSPVDPSKAGAGKPPSQEYADCMRRLQANLSYLAAIADAKKKATGSLPSGPAIMIPPPHLTDVHDLYKKLNTLFPEASQSNINKAMAFASDQNNKGITSAPGLGRKEP